MAHVLLAERALEKRDGNAAHAHTERAVAVEPRNVAAWLAHGDALLLAKRNKEARAALTEAVRLWTETKQLGAPLERLKIVKSALDQGKLPRRELQAQPQRRRAGRARERALHARRRDRLAPTRRRIWISDRARRTPFLADPPLLSGLRFAQIVP